MNLDKELETKEISLDDLFEQSLYIIKKNDKPYDVAVKKHSNSVLLEWRSTVLNPLFGNPTELSVGVIDKLWNIHSEGLVVIAMNEHSDKFTWDPKDLMKFFDEKDVGYLCKLTQPVVAKMWSIINEYIRGTVASDKYNKFFGHSTPLQWAKNSHEYGVLYNTLDLPVWTHEKLKDNAEKFSAILGFQPKL